RHADPGSVRCGRARRRREGHAGRGAGGKPGWIIGGGVGAPPANGTAPRVRARGSREPPWGLMGGRRFATKAPMRSNGFRRQVVRTVLITACMIGGAAALVACEEAKFTKSMVLGGKKVSASTLEAGRESYTHYCRACHGDEGNGK